MSLALTCAKVIETMQYVTDKHTAHFQVALNRAHSTSFDLMQLTTLNANVFVEAKTMIDAICDGIPTLFLSPLGCGLLLIPATDCGVSTGF